MEKEKQINYAPNYKIKDGCLCEIKHNKQGEYDKKLCNFTPWIVSEITVDDGVETSTRIRLAGVHESGRTLPEIEIAAEDWGTSIGCINTGASTAFWKPALVSRTASAMRSKPRHLKQNGRQSTLSPAGKELVVSITS